MKHTPPTYQCAICGEDFQRPAYGPHPPKVCSPECRKVARRKLYTKYKPCAKCGEPTAWEVARTSAPEIVMHKKCRYSGPTEWTCLVCGTTFLRSTADGEPMYCGPKCQGAAGRGDVRVAYEAGDWEAVTAGLKERTTRSVDGCWLWTGHIDGAGYPVVKVGKKWTLAHRVSVEAAHGKPLGSQPVHHKCAVRSCVNPDHLEAITHAANVGEMLARKAYVTRIRELEAALAELDPYHDLLARLPVA